MTFEDVLNQDLVPSGQMRAQYYGSHGEGTVVLYDCEWGSDRMKAALEYDWVTSMDICEIFPEGETVVFVLSEW